MIAQKLTLETVMAKKKNWTLQVGFSFPQHKPANVY